MITSSDPETERRRQLLLVIQYHAAQMDTDDLQRLAGIMHRAVLLKKVHPKLGRACLRFELALWRWSMHELNR